ncbi:MAG: hypothetical protein ACRD2L_16460, partial [Terriglobia bacterium]
AWVYRNLGSRLLGRRAYVDVNLFVAAKKPAAKYKQCGDHDDHEYHQNRNNSCTASTITVSHMIFLL